PSIAMAETDGSASSPQVLAPNSSEPQESSEVSTSSATDVMPAVEPSNALGETASAGGPTRLDANPLENNNAATDPSFAAPPARASQEERIARMGDCVRKEKAWREAKRAPITVKEIQGLDKASQAGTTFEGLS